MHRICPWVESVDNYTQNSTGKLVVSNEQSVKSDKGSSREKKLGPIRNKWRAGPGFLGVVMCFRNRFVVVVVFMQSLDYASFVLLRT